MAPATTASSPSQTNLSGDSNPTLSGDLDVGTHDIVSSSNNDISLLPNGTGKVVMDGNGSSGGISITDGLMEMRSGTSSPAQIDLYCEVSNAHKVSIKAPAHANYSGNVNFTLPAGNGTKRSVPSGRWLWQPVLRDGRAAHPMPPQAQPD